MLEPPAPAAHGPEDRYRRMLAEYAAGVRGEALPPESLHEVKRRLLDSIGVAMAAFAEEAPRAARAAAYELPVEQGATVWGTAFRTSPELAAFANGVLVRYLDFNDTYLSLEPLHPSDVIPALLALAEWRDMSAARLATAVATAYEIGVSLCDAASLRRHGWDHVNYIGVAVAAAAAQLLGLDVSGIEQAISMAVVPHAAMRETRAGELSMWKGAAAANSARNGLFAALLAWRGMTGPGRPFTGEMGFFRQLLGGSGLEEQALATLARRQPPRRILDTYVKYWPVEYHAQSAVDAALQLRREVGDPGRIESVVIETFRASYEILAKDPEKWEPLTRETADHSLPYVVAVALVDGRVTRESFLPGRLLDPALRRMLREAVTVRTAPDLDAGYPEGIPNRIRVRTGNGVERVREVRFPRGHARNPMTDDEVLEKFRANVGGVWSRAQADAVVEWVMGIEGQPGVRELLRLMRL